MYCHRINNAFSVPNDLPNSKPKLLLSMLYFSGRNPTSRIFDVDRCNSLFREGLTVREKFADFPGLVSIEGLGLRKSSFVLLNRKLS